MRKFKTEYTKEIFVEHILSKKKTKFFIRKDDTVKYPYRESKGFSQGNTAVP